MEEFPAVRIRPLSEKLQELAESELNEVPSQVPEAVYQLRSWIEKQPHLRARTDDQLLIAFLRGSKFSLEKAKQKIDRYYTMKSAIPEIFNEQRSVDDPIALDIIRAGIILQIPLPSTEATPCITIIRVGSYDITKFKFADILRVGTMFGDIMTLEDDNSTVCGYVEIMDMSHVTGAHFFQLRPDLLRKLSIFAEKAMPMRQRGTHFINVPPPFEKAFNALQSFFPIKALSRISVNAGPEAIFKFADSIYLPTEYGGECGNMQDIINRMECKIMKYRDYFIEEKNYGTDEKLRKRNPPCNENSLGLNGSFKKLDID